MKYARKCIFKKDEQSDPVTYTPDELYGYRFIDDKYFVSKEIKVGDVMEKQFVEYIVNGIVDLYTYATADGALRFFVQKDGSDRLVELTNEEHEIYSEDIKYLKKINRYSGPLKVMMSDAPSLNHEIDNATLDRRSLIALSKDYHNLVCSGTECLVYEKKLSKPMMEVGAVAGFCYTDFVKNVVQIEPYMRFEDDFKPAFTPAGGIYVKLFFPYLNHPVFIKCDMLIMSHSGKSIYYYYDDWSTPRDFTIKSTDFNSSLSIGTYLTDWKVRPIVNLGGFVNFPFKTRYTGINEYSYMTGHYAFFDTKSFGFSVSTGVAFKISNDRYVDLLAQYSRGYKMFFYFDYNDISLKVTVPLTY